MNDCVGRGVEKGCDPDAIRIRQGKNVSAIGIAVGQDPGLDTWHAGRVKPFRRSRRRNTDGSYSEDFAEDRGYRVAVRCITRHHDRDLGVRGIGIAEGDISILDLDSLTRHVILCPEVLSALDAWALLAASLPTPT